MLLLRTVILAIFLVTVSTKHLHLCVKCDQNDYNPICSDGKAYANLCVLKRAICLGKVVPIKWTYGICTLIGRNELTVKGDVKNSNLTFKIFG